ncbi:uncharacterized protein N7459_007025 [Penicillium hispanicum]|uniref:uncharacterized protein n=1 Tax=Penicillium hispanicum TaxID=1080232 RepID=UPI002540043E|nr:uncharacterized protein N7459_007025 [Penicillium hispanicum]KAJ5578061.1 hypothetical protein N7459_007025 [Penicillium hispanicum]
MVLAMSIFYDLRLNKPVPLDAHALGPLGRSFEECCDDGGDKLDPRTLEYERAILGCFLMSSVEKKMRSCGDTDIPTAHIHYIELCLSETAYTAISQAPIVNGISMPSFEHVEYLCQSVTAIRSWFDIFMQLMPSEFRGFSFPFSAQLACCVVTLYRLSTYTDPAWDCEAVRNTVDLLPLLDQVVEEVEQMSRDVGERSNEDLLMQLAGMMRLFRSFAGTKMTPEGTDVNGPYGDTGIITDSMAMDSSALTMMWPIDFGNDLWLEKIFGRH